MELDNNTIGNLLLGQMQIGLAYNDLFAKALQVGDGPVAAAKARQRMYELEIGAVFTAGQLLGYKVGFDAEDPATLTQQPVIQTETMIACREGNMDVISPAIKALVLVNSTSFLGSFGDELGRQAAAQSQGDPLAGWQTMRSQLNSYYCNRDNRGGVGPDIVKGASAGAVTVGIKSTNDIPEANRSELGNQLALLDTIAMAGYEFGIGDGIKAAQSIANCAQQHRGGTRGGKNKGRKMQRKRKMKGGFLSRETQLNLLTIAIILGGGYAAVGAGAFPAVIAGFDFCYRQGRSILYAMNWLKPPCVSDASIISGLLFKSVPGIGASARTCLEIARMNKIMNTALIGVAGTVYSTAIALGLKVVSGGELMSMPSRSFRLIKTQVSERLLNILESIATNLQPRAIEVFQAIATGAGNASEAARNLAGKIVNALTTTSTCPPSDPNTTAYAELAAAELGAQDASDEIASQAPAIIAEAGGDQSPAVLPPEASVTPEQQEALDTILSAMDPENRAAFVELVKEGTALRKAERKRTEIMALSDDAEKVAAFKREDTEMQKKIIGLMDEAQRTMLTNGGVDTAALLAGGRKRKTRRHRNKKKKAKTMRKKKTKGRRKPKRKTKGKKSKARRKTRNYRR